MIRISPFHWQCSDIFNISYWLISCMTLHISRCYGSLILTTSHLIRNETLEHEWIVICSATRIKVSHWWEVTIENGDPKNLTDLQMIHNLPVLGQTTVIGLSIQTPGTGDDINGWTNLQGWSNTEVQVIMGDPGLGIPIRIIDWSCMSPEIYLSHQRRNNAL